MSRREAAAWFGTATLCASTAALIAAGLTHYPPQLLIFAVALTNATVVAAVYSERP